MVGRITLNDEIEVQILGREPARLAQWSERFVYTEGVGGPIPSVGTMLL